MVEHPFRVRYVDLREISGIFVALGCCSYLIRLWIAEHWLDLERLFPLATRKFRLH
jgi:hypothetical protein